MDLFHLIDQAFWSRTLFGVPGYTWLTVLALWLALAVGFILVRRFIAWRLDALARHTHNQVDDLLAALVRRTHAVFLSLLAFFAAVLVLDLPPHVGEFAGRVAFLGLLIQAILWGNRSITLWIGRYRERKLEEDAAAVTSMQALAFLGRLTLWTVVLLLALDNFGIDVTALIAGLGVGGIAVALALQNILGDLFASLSIVLDKPFVVGDFLIINDHLGTVEQIGLKTTRLRSLSGEQLVFSNSDLLSSRIRNYKRMFERRVVFGFGVVYQTPPDQLAAIPGMVREIIEAEAPVRFDRAHFKAFGGSSLDFEVVYFVLDPDYNRYMDIQQAINLNLFRRFAAEGIDFAYPTQTLYVQGVGEELNGVTADVRLRD